MWEASLAPVLWVWGCPAWCQAALGHFTPHEMQRVGVCHEQGRAAAAAARGIKSGSSHVLPGWIHPKHTQSRLLVVIFFTC